MTNLAYLQTRFRHATESTPVTVTLAATPPMAEETCRRLQAAGATREMMRPVGHSDRVVVYVPKRAKL